MKKIPSLFKRNYGEGTRLVYDEVVEGCEWVLSGEGVATEKFDGTSCLVKNRQLFKRYDCKKGRTPPDGWIPCESERDPNTGHWPGWLLVSDRPEDKWHVDAVDDFPVTLPDGTYELVGPKVQSNPYDLHRHRLWRHGEIKLTGCPRDFSGIREYLAKYDAIEGIVWHHPDGRMCKIKRRDFGLEWPVCE